MSADAGVPGVADSGLVLSGVVLVTGTGTGIGKTMVTAALAGAALAAGRRVVVVKPVQTGVLPGEPGDLAEIRRLLAPLLVAQLVPLSDARLDQPAAARLDPQPDAPLDRLLDALPAGGSLRLLEFVRLPEPLAPQAAARRAGVALPPLSEHAERIVELARDADLVLVEGAGGLLVRLDGTDARGGTIADLGRLVAELGATGEPARAVIVTGAELGTLNLTELTVEALHRRGVAALGLVIGLWPAGPGLAERENRRDLPELTGVPLLGLIPAAPPWPPRISPIVYLDRRTDR